MGDALVAVSVPQLGDARRRHWAKVVTSVDETKATGWAYAGDFVADGGTQDLPVGALLLLYGERGSSANPQSLAALYSVGADSTLTLEGEARGRAWARTLRDRARELLDQEAPPLLDLSSVESYRLAEELASRGWKVEPPA
ncbi:MAG: hypothetical protein ACRDWA_08050 [Acidimicrobiia bacterium]